MNFALSALVIFLLLIPGILFNYSYLKGLGRRDGPIAIKHYGDYLVHSTIYALILNSVWAFGASRIRSISIDWNAVIQLLASKFSEQNGLPPISQHMSEITFYLLSLYAASALFGYLAHIIIRRTKLDKRFSLFRPDDLWYYMLSGEIGEFKENPFPEKFSSEDVDVLLTAVVTHGEQTFQYRGFVVDFGYDNQGDLDWVSLIYFDRQLLEQEPSRESRKGQMPSQHPTNETKENGHFENALMVLKYSEMNAIRLTYLSLRKKDEANGSPSRRKRLLPTQLARQTSINRHK